MRRVRWLVGAGVAMVMWLPASAPAAVPHMTYHGGPVMHHAGVYVVDYDATVPAAISGSDPGYLQTMAAHAGAVDSVFAVAAEYPDSAAAAANGMAYLGQSTITPAPSNDGATITDTQIQNELRAQITAGHLPAPPGDGMTTIYAIVLPPGKNVTFAGATNASCGVHFDATYGAQRLLGAVVVDTGSAPFAGGCGTSNAVANHQSFLSHELVETINDPLLNSGNPAWKDDTNGELGDVCTTTATNYGYTVQKLWSNALASCVASEAAHFSTPSVALDPLPSPTAGQPAPFGASGSSTNKATATSQLGPGIAAYAWNFGDGGSATGQTTSHSFAAPGPTTAAVTAIDALGFTASTSGALTVAPAPPVPASDPAPGGTGGGGAAPNTPASPAPAGAARPLPVITVAGTAKLTRSGQRLVLDTGRAAACPAGAGTCLVHVIVRPQLGGSRAARAAAPRTIGTATVAITAGHSTRLKVTLTKAAAQLARNQRLRVTVTLTAERGTATGTPNTIKLNLRTPAPRHTTR